MKERPILMNGTNVVSILEDRKTNTRRVMKPQPTSDDIDNLGDCETIIDMQTGKHIKCPYGKPGDRLWVRETFGAGSRPHPYEGSIEGLEYRADEAYTDEVEPLPLHQIELPDDVECLDKWMKGKWTPSIFMPRWACRLTLEITDIRIERLNEISRKEAMAEGCPYTEPDGRAANTDPLKWFQRLWESINGKGSWNKNPWVWVVEFKRCEKGRS